MARSARLMRSSGASRPLRPSSNCPSTATTLKSGTISWRGALVSRKVLPGLGFRRMMRSMASFSASSSISRRSRILS